MFAVVKCLWNCFILLNYFLIDLHRNCCSKHIYFNLNMFLRLCEKTLKCNQNYSVIKMYPKKILPLTFWLNKISQICRVFVYLSNKGWCKMQFWFLTKAIYFLNVIGCIYGFLKRSSSDQALPWKKNYV